MAFVVAPADGANSYVSLPAADEYVADHRLTFIGDDADKQAALIRASTVLDGVYLSKYSGTKSGGRTQTLGWPRDDATDLNGDEVTGIPSEVINATVEMAVRELASPGSLSPDVIEAQQKVLVAVDSIRWDVTSGKTGADAQRPVLTVVGDIMASLVHDSATKTLLRS